MPDSADGPEPEQLPANQAKVDQLCDAFERECLAQQRPDINRYLEGLDPSVRAQLLSRLIGLEIEYRHRAGDGVAETLGDSAAQDRDTPAGTPKSPEPALRARGELTTVTPYGGHGPGEQASAGEKGTGPTAPVLTFVGNYRIVGEISRGGMGVVYKAEQSSPHRFVALKVIRSDRKVTPEVEDRFRAEAEAAASLDHPNIVPVFETGEDQGQHYLAMAYVPGGSLADAIRHTPMPGEVAARHCKKISSAIHYAHRTGILHRDLKPSNVLIDQHGEPRVTDFGLAKRIEAARELTVTGAILGTPSYMPPEQARGEKQRVDERSDVYSLGALLFALLTGRPPFQAEGPAATLLQVIESEAPRPRKLNSDIDPALETICLKCIEKEPADRYASMQDVGDELEKYLQGLPIAARSVANWTRFARRITRDPALGLLAAMMAITVVLGAGLLQVVLSQPPTGGHSASSSFRFFGTDALYFVACVGPLFSVSKLLGTERTRRMEVAILRFIRHAGHSIIPSSIAVFQTLAMVLYIVMLFGVRALDTHPYLFISLISINTIALQAYLGWHRLRKATVWMCLALLLCIVSLDAIEFAAEYSSDYLLFTAFFVDAIVIASLLASALIDFALALVIFHTSTHALDQLYFRALQRTAGVSRSVLGWVPWPLSAGELSYRFDPFRCALGPLMILMILLPLCLFSMLLLIVLFCLLVPLTLVEKLRQLLTPETPVFSDLAAYLLSIAALMAMLLSRLPSPW